MPRDVLVERSAKSERLIGTEGGAMDHAIAFLGKEGKFIFYFCFITLQSKFLRLITKNNTSMIGDLILTPYFIELMTKVLLN